MTFSDTDLKRLKWAVENPAPNWIDKDNLKGLLFRLEAAEHVIERLPGKPGYTEAHLAWRKSCGK